MDPIFYASVLTYRVVCSHNPQRPEKIYVDICKDGFSSHDLLFEMQKKVYHDDKLERIFNDSKGIYLKEFVQSGEVRLIYVKHRDVMAQQRQNKLRQKVDAEILRVFRDMKQQHKIQTISVPVQSFHYDKLQNHAPVVAQSIYQETMQFELARQEKIKKLKQVRLAYYAKQKYAANPQLLLQWKQAARSGD